MAIDTFNSLSANPQSGHISRFSNACDTVFQPWFFQLCKFACVGALATIIQFSILVLLVQLLGLNPVVASVAGYLVSICFNYYLNYRVTFKATSAHKRTAVMFGLTAGVGLFLNALVMSLCLDVLHLKYIFAQVVASGFVFIWNFTVNKLWTFRAAARQPVNRTAVLKT
jgi:putative flippase GtrA